MRSDVLCRIKRQTESSINGMAEVSTLQTKGGAL